MYDSGGHVCLGVAAPGPARPRVADSQPRPSVRDSADPDPTVSALAEHNAVVFHGAGVTTGQLASFIECFGSYAQSRVTGTGRDQYVEGHGLFEQQKFEGQNLAELIDGALEELADLVNYSSMAAIKLLSVRRRFIS